MQKKKINVGIGFATGRRLFQRVLRSYIYSWIESGLVEDENISLNLFVAYDLTYKNTIKSDYTSLSPDIMAAIQSAHFIGNAEVAEAKDFLASNGVCEPSESSTLFHKGYAAQRNIILYYAIQNKMDYLLFLDDDEYPLSVSNLRDTLIWSGQHVLKMHLANIVMADITYGYHCGYVSPIPFLEFSDTLPESDFRQFIQAISNDIINWESIKGIMNHGGVTYADTNVLVKRKVTEVPEHHHAKFISGSNLCFNLTDPTRIFPFYNPPGARGEDTFLSTCLSDRSVLRVPAYTFHDGFSSYKHLLSGVLPTKMKFIKPDSDKIIQRFYRACLGWVRYKPLLLYITDQSNYQEEIKKIFTQLNQTLPQLCEFFGTKNFYQILKELKKYNKNVEKHYFEFLETKKTWSKVMLFLRENQAEPIPNNKDNAPQNDLEFPYE